MGNNVVCYALRASGHSAVRRGAGGRRLAQAAAFAVVLVGARRAVASNAWTWTGNSSSSWVNPNDWSPNNLPQSATDTQLDFGAASNYTSNQNITAAGSAFTLNRIFFDPNATSAYTLTGNDINFAFSGAKEPTVLSSSPFNVTITNNLALGTDTNFVTTNSSATMYLNGQISGGRLHAGGHVVLGHSNTFTGGAQVEDGSTLELTTEGAIPAGVIDVGDAAKLFINYAYSSTPALHSLNLSGSGMLAVAPTPPSTFVEADISNLSAIDSASINLSGSYCILDVNSISVSGNCTFAGGSTSKGTSDFESPNGPVPLTVSSGATLTNGIPLDYVNLPGIFIPYGYTLSGGGTLFQTGAGSDADLVVDGFSYLRFANPSAITTGALTIQGSSILQYSGSAPATLGKSFAVGSGGAQIAAPAGVPLTLSGVISETGGAGQALYIILGPVTLAGANTYTGKTDAYAGGTVSINTMPNGGVAGPLGKSSNAPANLVIEDGTLQYTGASTTTDRGLTVTNATSSINVTTAATNLTISGQITGSGALNKTSSGTLTLSNSTNNYTGGTFVNAGTLLLGSSAANQLPSGGNVTVASGATLNLGTPGFGSSSNVARPLGTLTVNGGTVKVGTLGSAGTYDAAALAMTGGTLDFSQSGSAFGLRLQTAVTINASNTTAVWLGNSSQNDDVVNLGAGTLTITVAKGTTTSGIDLDSSVSLEGAVANRPFVKAGLGVMRMTQQDFDNANLTVAAGTLRLDDVGVFNDLTTVSFGSSLALAGGTFQYGGAPSATAAANPLTLGTGGGSIDLPSAGVTLTLPGVIGGSGGLTKTGSGTLVLTAANNYAGVTTISGGVLVVGNGGTAGNIGTAAVTVAAGATGVFSRSDNAYTINNAFSGSGSLQFLGTSTINQGGFLLRGNNSSFTGTFTVGAAGQRARLGIISSNQLGTGAVTVTQGSSLYLGGATYPNALTLSGNGWNEQAGQLGALRLDAAAVVSGAVTLAADTRVTTFSSGDAGTISGPISGSFALTKTGSGTLALAGANTYGGATTVSAGTLSLSNATALPGGNSITVSAGAQLVLNFSSGNNSGSAALGTLTLNGGTLAVPAGDADYYVGNLGISNGGAVNLTGSDGFWLHLTGSGGINISGNSAWTGGGTSRIQNDTTAAIPLAVTGGGALSNGIPLATNVNSFGFTLTSGTLLQVAGGSSAPLVVSGFSDYEFANPSVVTTGPLTVQGASTLQYNGSAASTFSKSFALGSGGGQIVVPAGVALTLSGVISETGGTGQPLFVLSGPVVLSGSNTYTGKTQVSAGGTISIGSMPNGGVASPLGASTNAPDNLQLGNSVFAGDGTLQYTGPTASTDRGVTLANAGSNSTIDIATAATTLTMAGKITGPGALTKAGAGTLLLLNTISDYANGTNVNAGTLTFASVAAIPSGPVTVANGATLNLNANNAGGILTRTLSSLTIAGGGKTAVLAPASHANRTVLVTSALSIANPAGAWTGTLDLSGNDAVIHGGSLSNIQSQAKSGLNLAGGAAGYWNGPGIDSSTAAADTTFRTTLGAILNNNGTGQPIYSTVAGNPFGSFDGQNTIATDVLIKYTYFGDADLNGKVNGTDYSQIDNGFNTRLTGWLNGDFNYDGVVDGTDYSLIDNVFNTQGSPLNDGSSASLVASVASEVAIANSSAVPEPGTISLIALTAVGLLTRRLRTV